MSGTQRVKYETNRGTVMYAIIDEASGISAVSGAEPSGDIEEPMTVRVSKNRRESGIRPRTALLAREIGDSDTISNCLVQGATRYRTVTVLTSSHYNSLNVGTSYTIGGQAWVLTKLQDEVVT